MRAASQRGCYTDSGADSLWISAGESGMLCAQVGGNAAYGASDQAGCDCKATWAGSETEYHPGCDAGESGDWERIHWSNEAGSDTYGLRDGQSEYGDWRPLLLWAFKRAYGKRDPGRIWAYVPDSGIVKDEKGVWESGYSHYLRAAKGLRRGDAGSGGDYPWGAGADSSGE